MALGGRALKPINRSGSVLFLNGLTRALLLSFFLPACSVDNAKNHSILAEKLWTDRKYSAAIFEYEKVIQKDPTGKLGLLATYRSAMTQYLFLSQYNEAIRKFQRYIQSNGEAKLIWESQLHIGEIFFLKTEQYDQAILHYRSLLKLMPNAPEAPEFLYRIAKSQFFLLQFSDAVHTYEELVRTYPKSTWSEKAIFEIGNTYFTQGEQLPELGGRGNEEKTFHLALSHYEDFVRKYPASPLLAEARFGIASCLEELDRMDEAYRVYESLQNTYPSPQVIRIKLSRVRERMSQRRTVR